MTDKTRGLYGKYHVERVDLSPKHPDCSYFVLDLTHDPLARPAVLSYAAAAEDAGLVVLADDLRKALVDPSLLPAPEDPEPHGEVETMHYWTHRIMTGDASTAGGSMDLDYSHDELAKAARTYLGLDKIAEKLEAVATFAQRVADDDLESGWGEDIARDIREQAKKIGGKS